MQPIDPDKSPKVHVPALNHVGLWVDHLPNAVEYLSVNGVKFTPGTSSTTFYQCSLGIYDMC